MSDDDDLGVGDLFPPSENVEIFKYKFGDISLNIRSQELQNVNTQPSTGLLIWPASMILSSYIQRFNSEFTDKHILELGTGVGICGLIASKYSKSIMLTDGDSKTFDQLSLNIDENSHLYNVNNNKEDQSSSENSTHCCTNKPKIFELKWGKDQPSLDQLKSKIEQPFDIVIGSDLIYQDASIEPLFYTVDQLLSNTPDSTFYLSFLDRKNHLPTVERVSKQFKFKMFTIPVESFHKEEVSPMAKMFLFKRE